MTTGTNKSASSLRFESKIQWSTEIDRLERRSPDAPRASPLQSDEPLSVGHDYGPEQAGDDGDSAHDRDENVGQPELALEVRKHDAIELEGRQVEHRAEAGRGRQPRQVFVSTFV